MDDATTSRPTRRRFLRAAAVGVPAAAAAATAAAVPAEAAADFTHRGHRLRVTREGRRVSVQVDGRTVPVAVRVRGDGVLACPDLLPFSDAEWGTDVRALARRLVDGNGVDYVLF